ncbi:MAG: glycosyltransferase family 1 protein [Pyrinomonadaceae bacterium]
MNILAYVHLRNIHNSTGAGRVARQLVEHLSSDETTQLRVLADPLDHQRIVHQVGAPWTNYNYHFFNHETSKQQARWILTGSPEAERFWPEAQIVYCTAESYVPTKTKRLVVTLHDAAYFEEGAHRKNRSFRLQQLKWKLLYRMLDRKADLFHTVSRFSAERIAHFMPSLKSRLRVVHNGIPPRFFAPVSPEGETYLREMNLIDEQFILLPRGLHFRKNADLVLQAWPHLRSIFPGLKLVVTSHSEPEYVAKAKALGDSVMLTGFVSDEALCSLYHAAQVVWFPSLYEGFGLPVLEAMACRAPVVASDSSSLPEVAGSAAWLVSTTSVSQHVEALESLLNDAQRRESYQQRGAIHAASFTWERSATELRQHFAAIA